MKFDSGTFIGIFFYTIFAIGVFILFSVLKSSGNINYCYIEQQRYDEYYHLRGSISWSADITISQVSSIEEGISQANKLHCKLWSTK